LRSLVVSHVRKVLLVEEVIDGGDVGHVDERLIRVSSLRSWEILICGEEDVISLDLRKVDCPLIRLCFAFSFPIFIGGRRW
jgi:hypothetical protein